MGLVFRQSGGGQKPGDSDEPALMGARPTTVGDFVRAAEANWREYAAQNPENAAIFEKSLMGLAGVPDPSIESWVIIRVPVDSPHMQYLGTTCGKIPQNSKALGHPEVISLLRRNNVDHLIGIVVEPNMDAQLEGGVEFQGLVLPLNEKEAEKLSDIVYGKGGTLRPDSCRVPGWTSFESE